MTTQSDWHRAPAGTAGWSSWKDKVVVFCGRRTSSFLSGGKSGDENVSFFVCHSMSKRKKFWHFLQCVCVLFLLYCRSQSWLHSDSGFCCSSRSRPQLSGDVRLFTSARLQEQLDGIFEFFFFFRTNYLPNIIQESMMWGLSSPL